MSTSGRKTAVLWAVTIACLFISATTFGSLGVPVFAMAGEFGWSEAEAGGAFTSLTLVCALTSLLPIWLLNRFGGRITFVAGSLVLALGFMLASEASSIGALWLAAGLAGLAFSLLANVPGIYLIAAWYGDRAPRVIALYLMVSNAGGVLGPLVADRLIGSPGGWRGYWHWMAGVAVALAVACAVAIRDVRSTTEAADGDALWGLGATVRRPQFIWLAITMVLVQACIITVSSVLPAHFARLGHDATTAATMLSLQALVGMVASGLAGPIGERFDPKKLLVASLVAQAAGLALLAFAREIWTVWAFVVLFGSGWAVATFAITVLLIRWFGHRAGSAALSAVWMLCGLAAFGPALAGYGADLTGSFAPALLVGAALSLPLAVAAWLLRAPAAAAVD